MDPEFESTSIMILITFSCFSALAYLLTQLCNVLMDITNVNIMTILGTVSSLQMTKLKPKLLVMYPISKNESFTRYNGICLDREKEVE